MRGHEVASAGTGEVRVRRLLPALARQSVGPFVFFDHFGPFAVEAEADIDVRPHPHVV